MILSVHLLTHTDDGLISIGNSPTTSLNIAHYLFDLTILLIFRYEILPSSLNTEMYSELQAYTYYSVNSCLDILTLAPLSERGGFRLIHNRTDKKINLHSD